MNTKQMPFSSFHLSFFCAWASKQKNEGRDFGTPCVLLKVKNHQPQHCLPWLTSLQGLGKVQDEKPSTQPLKTTKKPKKITLLPPSLLNYFVPLQCFEFSAEEKLQGITVSYHESTSCALPTKPGHRGATEKHCCSKTDICSIYHKELLKKMSSFFLPAKGGFMGYQSCTQSRTAASAVLAL